MSYSSPGEICGTGRMHWMHLAGSTHSPALQLLPMGAAHGPHPRVGERKVCPMPPLLLQTNCHLYLILMLSGLSYLLQCPLLCLHVASLSISDTKWSVERKRQVWSTAARALACGNTSFYLVWGHACHSQVHLKTKYFSYLMPQCCFFVQQALKKPPHLLLYMLICYEYCPLVILRDKNQLCLSNLL